MKEREIKKLKDKIKQLEEENTALKERVRNLEALIGNLLSSSSWKITAPLRASKKMLKALYHLFDYNIYKAALDNYHHLKKKDGKWIISGTTPYFVLKSQFKNLAGAVYFKFKGDFENSFLPFAVYYDTGSGFQGAQRVMVNFNCRSSQSAVFFLPAGVKALRIDPFIQKGSFVLKEVEIVNLGWFWFFLKLLRDKREWFSSPAKFKAFINKVVSILRRGGPSALKASIQKANTYSEWVQCFDSLSDDERELIKKHIKTFSFKPLISVVMPVYNVEKRWLIRAIESVRSQLYPYWELCIADDASTKPYIKEVLEEYCKKDKRIR